MDFGKINTAEDSNTGATYHVVDPYTDEPAYVEIDGNDVPVTITVLGPDSDKMRQYQSNMMKSMMKRRKTSLDADDLERKMTGQLVESVMSWQGVMMNGEVLACNRENAKELFDEHRWLREQLLGFQQERANFLKS
jgi:hypothetical protein